MNTLSQTTITAYSDQERHVPIKRDAHHFGFDADSSSEMNTDSSFDSNRTEHKSKTAPVPFERQRLKERIERIKSAPSSSAHPFPLCFAANSHFPFPSDLLTLITSHIVSLCIVNDDNTIPMPSMTGFRVLSYSTPGSSRAATSSDDDTHRDSLSESDHGATVNVELCRVLKPSVSDSIHCKPLNLHRQTVSMDDLTMNNDEGTESNSFHFEASTRSEEEKGIALHRSIESVQSIEPPTTYKLDTKPLSSDGTSVSGLSAPNSKPSYQQWLKSQGSKQRKQRKKKRRRHSSSNRMVRRYRKLKKQWNEWSEHNGHCIRFRRFQYLGRKYVTTTKAFRWFILLCILINCIFIAIEDPATEENTDSTKKQLSSIYILTL